MYHVDPNPFLSPKNKTKKQNEQTNSRSRENSVANIQERSGLGGGDGGEEGGGGVGSLKGIAVWT